MPAGRGSVPVLFQPYFSGNAAMWIAKQYAKPVAAVVVLSILLWLQARYEFTRLSESETQMAPAVAAGSIYLLDQSFSSPGDFRHSDVVFFSYNTGKDYKMFVSRVAGLPGEHITVEDGCLKRNGSEVAEIYLPQPFPGIWLDVVVPRGYLFVLNDNRESLNDSRTLGPVPWTAVYGRMRK
jgi:signal peptidase I